MRIALLITCLADTLYPEVGRSTVTVLERLGHTVSFPEEQTCCGQMHANTGYRTEALPLVRRLVRAFHEDGADAVVCPSGSCTAMIREQYRGMAAETGDAGLQRAVDDLVPDVLELSELLVGRLGVEDVGAAFPHRVAYHPTCHSLRLLRVGDAPTRLLRAVAGLDLAELPEAEECCGFGGTFAVKNAEVSTAMLTDKVRAVLDTQAEVVCASDASCLMHIGGALHRQRTGVRTRHLAEILAATAEPPA